MASSLNTTGRTVTYTPTLYQRRSGTLRRGRRGVCLEGIEVEFCNVFHARGAADHDHGLGVAGHGEFLELAPSSLRHILFKRCPHGFNRSAGLLLLFGSNTGIVRDTLTHCGNGVFPKPCAHPYLSLEPTGQGERHDDKSNFRGECHWIGLLRRLPETNTDSAEVM